jgi:hypothetical protein
VMRWFGQVDDADERWKMDAEKVVRQVGLGILRQYKITLVSEILVPRVLWRFENREKSEKSEKSRNYSTLLHMLRTQAKQHFHILLNLQCLKYLRSTLRIKI